MRPCGMKVFPSHKSDNIRRSHSLFHYERPPKEPGADYDQRYITPPKISSSDYKVTTLPSRIIDEPDYDKDEEERLSGKGTPERKITVSVRKDSTSPVERPPHRTNPLSSSPIHSAPSTIERRSRSSSVGRPMIHHNPIKIRVDNNHDVRDTTIRQSELILEDLDSILEEHLSFDKARQQIMDKNLSFRQYATVPYRDNDEDYDYVEVYTRRITRKETIINEDDLTKDTIVARDPEVAERIRKLANGKVEGATPMFHPIIVNDLRKAGKQGVKEVNEGRRRKAEDMYEWTIKEVDLLQKKLSPDVCIQHVSLCEKDEFTRIPEWKRRLLAKKISQEAIAAETQRLWDEFESWRRVHDPAWKPSHPVYDYDRPVLR